MSVNRQLPSFKDPGPNSALQQAFKVLYPKKESWGKSVLVHSLPSNQNCCWVHGVGAGVSTNGEGGGENISVGKGVVGRTKPGVGASVLLVPLSMSVLIALI